MRWHAAHAAKVAGSIDDSGPKVSLPDTVDDRAPCEYVPFVRDPPSERCTTATFIASFGQIERRSQPWHAGQRARCSRDARRLNAPTRKYVYRPRLQRWAECARARKI